MAGTAQDTPLAVERWCLTRTCLQWTADGELSDVDRRLVLARLAEADQRDLQQSMEGSEDQACR